MKVSQKYKIENYEQLEKNYQMLQQALDHIINDETSRVIRIKDGPEEHLFRFFTGNGGFIYFTCTFRYKPTGQKDSTNVYCLDEIESRKFDSHWTHIVREAASRWRSMNPYGSCLTDEVSA